MKKENLSAVLAWYGKRGEKMATSKKYLSFILDQLSELDGISHRQAFGEYMIYHNGKVSAYLCDDRLLVKITPSVQALMPDAPHEPPYEGAKDMLLVEDVDNRTFLKELFEAMWLELTEPKSKKKRQK